MMKATLMLALTLATTGAWAHDLTVITAFADGTKRSEQVTLTRRGDVAEYRVPREAVRPGTKSICLQLDFARATKGEDGYFVTSKNTIGYFRHDDGTWRMPAITSLMPVFGMKTPRTTFVAIGTGMPWSFSQRVEAKGGAYLASLTWDEDLDRPYEDFVMRFVFLKGDDADYSGMARAYRTYQLDRGACRPLADRAKERPALA